jgi:hypothetical protein
MSHAPHWLFHGLAVLGLLLLLYSFSYPGSAYKAAFVAGFLLIGLAVVWVVRLVAVRRAKGRGQPVGSIGLFAVFPVIVVVCLALCFAGIPLQVRWSASKGAFDTQVRKVEASHSFFLPKNLGGSRTIGSYAISSVGKIGTAVRFDTKEGDFLGRAGFVWAPHGITPAIRKTFSHPTFTHLNSHWYAWTDHN